MMKDLYLVCAIFAGIFTFSFVLGFFVMFFSAYKADKNFTRDFVGGEVGDFIFNTEIFSFIFFLSRLPKQVEHGIIEWKKNPTMRLLFWMSLVSIICLVLSIKLLG